MYVFDLEGRYFEDFRCDQMLSNPLNKESVLMINFNKIQEEINFEQLNKLKNQIINE